MRRKTSEMPPTEGLMIKEKTTGRAMAWDAGRLSSESAVSEVGKVHKERDMRGIINKIFSAIPSS